MSAEKDLRKSLESCNVCNVALVETIRERVGKGEKVSAICRDLVDYQRQLHGEIYYTANALRQRYIDHYESKNFATEQKAKRRASRLTKPQKAVAVVADAIATSKAKAAGKTREATQKHRETIKECKESLVEEDIAAELYERMLKAGNDFLHLVRAWRELGKPMDDEKIKNILAHLYEEVQA